MLRSPRGRLIGGLLAVVLAACGGSTHSSSAAGVKWFTSRMYDYKLAYPRTWSVVSADQQLADQQPPVLGTAVTDVISPHASRHVRELAQPALVVGAQSVPREARLTDWTEEVTALVSRFKGCPAPDLRTNLRVGGEPAVDLLYRNCPRGSGLYHVWTALLHNGRGYQLVWFDSSPREGADTALRHRVVDTVAFTR